ncbi:hypothetical protein FQR65_LT06369 [Abscondita terminalis]|nr:hypothetical protein FQR65_LT06369 [Abscondita terminalis]
MSNYTIQQLEIVQFNINHINKITHEAQDELEEKKSVLIKQIYSITKTREPTVELDEDELKKVEELENVIDEIELNIQNIQQEHDQIIGELEKNKQVLKKMLSTLGKLEGLIKVLTYKIFDTQQEFNQKVLTLKAEKDKTLQRSDLPNSTVVTKSGEIERQISDVTNVHEETLLVLEGQRKELRIEYAMKSQHMESTVESVRVQYHAILMELQKLKYDANEYELDEINRRISELERLYRNDIDLLNDLRNQGWKGDGEKLPELLDTRGASEHHISICATPITPSEPSCIESLKSPDLSSSTTVTSKKIDSQDVLYLKRVFGKSLALALAEVAMKKPRDPIHYLGHWLFKYRYNQEISQERKREIEELICERERLEKEKLHAMLENEAHAIILDMIIRAEEEAIRNELERIARETMQAQVEDLEYNLEAEDVLGEYNGPSVNF